MSTTPTVFVVDDDPAARASMSALVQSMGVPVESFASAEELLESIILNQPGCVVTDYRMVGMTGLELQEELARNNFTLPVIVITAYADVPTAVRAMESGAVTFLEKPCDEETLCSSIRRALDADADARGQHTRTRELRARLESLTTGERDVLNLLVQGKMNKNIAKDLDIGLRTVELRRHQIMKKLDVNSVAEVVRLVFEAQVE